MDQHRNRRSNLTSSHHFNAAFVGRVLSRILSTAGIVVLVAAPMAQAGSTTINAGGGNQVTFEYNDSMLRINNSVESNSYVVMRDGTMYTVAMAGNMPMVMDAGAMMKSLGNMPDMDALTPPTGAADLDGRVIELKDTGENETIAGISGDVYELVLEEANGNQRTETLVLSSDERVLEFRDAMLLMVDLAAEMAPEQNMGNAMQQSEELEKRLRSMNAGVLRYGNQMSVTEITGDAIPAARFELPAEPMDLQGLGGMLGEMQKRMQQP
jgi:hypothetical protein